jgi:hypothetical protein
LRSFIRRFRIRSLRAKVDVSRGTSVILANGILAATTDVEKDRLARRFDRALQRTHTLQHKLEVLERKERESAAKSTQRLTLDH